MKTLYLFLICLALYSCGQGNANLEIEALQKELETTKTALDEANTQKDYTPGLIHTVFFWLNEDISKTDRDNFVTGLKELEKISTVKKVFIGPPAGTENRGVVDHSYSFALIIQFDNMADQDAYQIDPIHLKFIEDHQDKWRKVVVYDSDHLSE